MKKFTPTIPRNIGKTVTMALTQQHLEECFGNPKYRYSGQRHHEKNARKRKHTHGMLTDASLDFASAYCEETKEFLNMDGYHRYMSLASGVAYVPPGHDIILTIKRVKTRADIDRLYDKYNSPTAAKNAASYMESGLRQGRDVLGTLVSPWCTKRSNASALQLAAGVKGTVETRFATQVLKDGLELIDTFRLPVRKHETVGVRAVYLAIAQHSPDQKVVEEFIRTMNYESWDPQDATLEEKVILFYRQALLSNKLGSTGGSPNQVKFVMGLAAFARYAFLRRGKAAPTVASMTLPEFMELIKQLRGRRI